MQFPYEDIRLRRRALRPRVTQEDAARRAGLTTRAWQVYERGENEPRWSDAEAMLAVVGMIVEIKEGADVRPIP